MQGVRRTKGIRQRRVKPVVKDDLLEMLPVLGQQKPLKTARDQALLLIGWGPLCAAPSWWRFAAKTLHIIPLALSFRYAVRKPIKKELAEPALSHRPTESVAR